MDRYAQLMSIARNLLNASQRGDWTLLQSVDRQLAELLVRRTEWGQWSQQEMMALATVQRAHEQARERCVAETEAMRTRLGQIRQQKAGWMAYAMNGEVAEERP
ncbi:hypothetical protein [Steroidobacter sp.]|uniref:hypothetical protein n=1 Tax=Steroidobacter sp. TaxID=1978227 RepID=UPI002ED84719